MHEHQPQNSAPADAEADHAPNHEQQPGPQPRIYVASLADYNNGRLHGTWLDAAREASAIRADIAAMLASSQEPDAEEFAIHDFDEFGAWRVDEDDSVDLVAKIARGIAQHGLAFAAWAEANESDPERFDDFEAAYLGHYASLDTYAYQIADDFGFHAELEKLPESMRTYVSIDYAQMARDLEAGGDLYVAHAPDGGVWLFHGDV